MALWDEAEVLNQFAWSKCSSAQVYEVFSGCMQEFRHDHSVHQCFIKVKALSAQWLTVTNHNLQSFM